MKNKHLLLLFLATIAVGLLARRVPWFKDSLLQTSLIEVDTTRLTQISIYLPDQPELLIERTESGWAATQEILATSISGEHMAPMLAALASVRSLRIYASERPDTLGFSKKTLIQVQTYIDDALLEQFEIGNEIIENGQPATWIRLNRHEGIYLVEQHLRGIFSKKLDNFRQNRVTGFEPASVAGIVLESWESGESGSKTRVWLSNNDTTAQWSLHSAPEQPVAADSVLNWLRQFVRLNGSPFADHFDESSARETIIGRLTLYQNTSDSLVFQLYRVRKERTRPEYILHSSQNPGNFFAPTDTLLLRRIFFGWVPAGASVPRTE